MPATPIVTEAIQAIGPRPNAASIPSASSEAAKYPIGLIALGMVPPINEWRVYH
jgi:hypothetical protein